MSDLSGVQYAHGLANDERAALHDLLQVYAGVRARNRRIESYYEGDVMVKDIGVDVLPPECDIHVDLSCDWPRKAVDGLANIVRFEGFVTSEGELDEGLAELSLRQNLVSAFNRHLIGEVKMGCMFATVNRWGNAANVRFHSAESGAAIWDVENERIAHGFVIADKARTPWSRTVPVPVKVNLHMPGKVVVLTRLRERNWIAESMPHPLDRPLMEVFSYKATDTKPLGTSRITRQVRDLVDDALRVRLAMAVSTAFYAVPQKALLGLTDKQFDALKKSKWATYINSVLLTTRDKNGNVPQLVQLPSNSPQALIDIIKNDAALFSGATGIPLNSLGIAHDNPSSAEAIDAMRRDLADEAETVIRSNKESLETVARMVMAVGNNVSLDMLGKSQMETAARFANPRMPTAAAAADLAVKLASSRPGFADTDVFLEMQGFDAATIKRIKAEERQAKRQQTLMDIFANGGERTYDE